MRNRNSLRRYAAHAVLIVLLGLVALGLSAAATAETAWGEEGSPAAALSTGNCINDVPQIFVGDFNGDGRADLGLYRSSQNAFYVALSRTDRTFDALGSKQWVGPNAFGYSGGRYYVGDFDGDGRDDLGFFDPADNSFHVSLSTGSSFGKAGSGRWIAPNTFGHSGGRYYVGYFNGGSRADLGFFDPTNNSFSVSLSTGSGFNAPGSGQWISPNEFGNAGGQYFVGDFKGDGTDDLGFFEPTTGLFSVSVSDGTDFGKPGSGPWIPAGEFGNAGGRFYVGDFNGDDKDDLGFFEPGDNSFWVALSNGSSFPFASRKRWVPPNALGHRDGTHYVGDFNANGRYDLGFLEPSNLSFYVGVSTGGGFDSPASGFWANLNLCRTYVPFARKN